MPVTVRCTPGRRQEPAPRYKLSSATTQSIALRCAAWFTGVRPRHTPEPAHLGRVPASQ